MITVFHDLSLFDRWCPRFPYITILGFNLTADDFLRVFFWVRL